MSQNQLDWQVEPLEDRQLMAGNVDVQLTAAGDLQITGDNQSNRILIEQTGVNELRVAAEDLLGSPDDTSINGGPAGNSITISYGALRDLKINMRGGHDQVQVRSGPPTISAPLAFRNGIANGGAGSDLIFIGESLFNPLQTATTRFVGSLRLTLGASASFSHFQGSDLSHQWFGLVNVDVEQDLSVRGSSRSDYASANMTTVQGNSTFRLGGGVDAVSLGESTLAGPAFINTGAGDDGVFLKVTTNGSLTVNTGGGDDTVFGIAITTNGAFTLNTGPGKDTIWGGTITTNGSFIANTGAGRDRFVVQTFTASGSFTANGGAGRDQFQIGTFNQAQEPVIRSFEDDFVSP